jgi:hypothetical protein
MEVFHNLEALKISLFSSIEANSKRHINAHLINEFVLTSDSSLDERKSQITIWVKILSTVIVCSRIIHATREALSRILSLRFLDIAVSSDLFV